MSKVMALLSGKPLIGHVMDRLAPLSPERTVAIVGHKKESVIDYLKTIDGLNVNFVEQAQQLGTGHAVAQAEPVLTDYDGEVLILSADVPLLSTKTISDFLENHLAKKPGLSVLNNSAGPDRLRQDCALDRRIIPQNRAAKTPAM